MYSNSMENIRFYIYAYRKGEKFKCISKLLLQVVASLFEGNLLLFQHNIYYCRDKAQGSLLLMYWCTKTELGKISEGMSRLRKLF